MRGGLGGVGAVLPAVTLAVLLLWVPLPLAGMIDLPVLAIGTDVMATDVALEPAGTRFRLTTPNGSSSVSLPLAGEFNVSNALIAAGCALELGFDLEAIVGGLESVGQIPGRFEIVPAQGKLTVVVDYAHTPDGVDTVIDTARALAAGEITVVLGAGGAVRGGSASACGGQRWADVRPGAEAAEALHPQPVAVEIVGRQRARAALDEHARAV